jgi:heme-degrading monooxygenase HmoA
MKRRSCLKAMLAAAGGAVLPAVALADPQASGDRPIQLHADLAVDPAKEQEMLEFFEQKFRPAAAQQPGYIDLKMLKLKSTLRGAAPPGTNYQFVLTFSSEALRQKWVATELHKQLWPIIEGSLTDKDYSRLLYEVY